MSKGNLNTVSNVNPNSGLKFLLISKKPEYIWINKLLKFFVLGSDGGIPD